MVSFVEQMNNLWMQQYPPAGIISANAGSDTHVTGFSNQRYQCQPRTDALYFRNLAAEFEMHGRHEGANSGPNSPTRISAIAIRVKSQRIEYKMQGRNFLDQNNNGFLIDGTTRQLTDRGVFLAESQTSIVLENSNTFHVYTTTGIKVTVCNCGGSNLNVTLALPRSIAQNAEPSVFGNLIGGHGRVIPAKGIFSNALHTASVGHEIPQIPSNATWSQNATTIITGLSNPFGVAVDQDDGTVYVAEWGNKRIISWNPNTNQTNVIVSNLGGPRDVLIDKETNSIIIADYGNKKVLRCSLENGKNQVETIIDNIGCWGLTMDNEGSLYVCDVDKSEVRKFPRGEKTGILVAGGNGQGNGNHQLSYPLYIALDDEGSLYVSDTNNCRVMKWNKEAKEGITVAGGNGKGSNNNQLNSPNGIVVDSNGNIYVADSNNHRVTRWRKGEKTGEILVGGNGEGNGMNQLYCPIGLSFDRQNNLYVVDHRNNRVRRFALK